MKSVLKNAAFAFAIAVALAACKNNQSDAAASVSSAAPTVAETTPASNVGIDTTKTATATPVAVTPTPQSATESKDIKMDKKALPATTAKATVAPVPGNPAPVAPVNANTAAQPATAAATSGKITSIKWETMTYDWGSVKEGDKVNQVFKFKNTGTEPLVIIDAKPSCGCTVPEKPQAPIAPGKTGELKVTFDSAHKSGPTTKTITVTANTEPANMVLTIKGDIKAKE